MRVMGVINLYISVYVYICIFPKERGTNAGVLTAQFLVAVTTAVGFANVLARNDFLFKSIMRPSGS